MKLDLDIKHILESDIEWSFFKDKSILITGATGMLCQLFSKTLIAANKRDALDIRLTLLVRDKNKAKSIFGDESKNLSYLEQSVEEKIDNIKVDMILHAAGNSSPYYIENDPVGIINANVKGTQNILDLAKECNAKVWFTSTREVYGSIAGIKDIKETDFGSFDPLQQRSCYPESKRMAETMLKAYAAQFGLNYVVVRIAHSYGPGMALNDGRVMSDIIGGAVIKRKVELLSDGSAVRSFCYVSDAVTAMFLAFTKGNNDVFNIANEEEELSILELANLVSETFVDCKVSYIKSELSSLYCQYERVKLNTDKIRSLGWVPAVSIRDGVQKVTDNLLKSEL